VKLKDQRGLTSVREIKSETAEFPKKVLSRVGKLVGLQFSAKPRPLAEPGVKIKGFYAVCM